MFMAAADFAVDRVVGAAGRYAVGEK